MIFTDLRTAEKQYPELLARMIGKTVNVEEGKFAALAGAFAQNGVLLYVPKGVIVEEPLHSVLWGQAQTWLISRISLSWWMKALR